MVVEVIMLEMERCASHRSNVNEEVKKCFSSPSHPAFANEISIKFTIIKHEAEKRATAKAISCLMHTLVSSKEELCIIAKRMGHSLEL